MYWLRTWQPGDLGWMSQAVTAAAWESLAPDERSVATPAQVAYMAGQQLQQALASGYGMGLVVLGAERPVGFVLGALGPDASTDEVHGHIFTLWVAPGHRRRGLGRQLYQAMEQWLSRTGVRKVKICTGIHNKPAVELARSAGFQPEGLIGMKEL